MAINTSLLVSSAILQDVFVDPFGQPMSAGTITCYKDTSRTVLKNWYYQTGSPGAYTYVALPNPLTLSAAGTIADANGVDTIPFFYPYNEEDFSETEPYYIVIKNYNETNQLTRANFPFGFDSQIGPSNETSSEENFIVNNAFWRNAGTASLTNELDIVLSPSQHDGFRMPDMRFIKNSAGSVETVRFQTFFPSPTSILIGDPTPEYFLNHECTSVSLGETQKVYQFPISYRLGNLVGQQCTITIQGQNAGGSGSSGSTVNIYILQDLGTGVATQAPFLVGSISFQPSWQKFVLPYTLPGNDGLAISPAGDDGLYLQIGMPLNAVCNLNFTKPSLYLSENQAPINDFKTYDQIDPIINGNRTGDIRFSLNNFTPFGWTAANDGVIGKTITPITACYGASTANLTGYVYNNGTAGVGATLTAPSNGVFIADGLTVPQGSIWLYKNDTTALGAYNGIYTLTNAGGASAAAVLTRVATYDSPAEINDTSLIPVTNGTANANTNWLQTNTIVSVGTTPLTYSQSRISRSNVDTWPLYNLLWNAVSQTYAPVSGGRGLSAYADFVDDKPMQLTKTLSRVLGASGQGESLSDRALGETAGVESFVMAANQMPAHTHSTTFATLRVSRFQTDQATVVPNGQGNNTTDYTSGSAGGATPVSLMQPSVFYNVFFKL